MTHDLHMDGTQYNIALTCFFFPYALFMVPSNMILKIIKPSLWMTILMVLWGTVMTMHGLVQTYGQLCACRALLGLCETGFTPAASYLLTTWYCVSESVRKQMKKSTLTIHTAIRIPNKSCALLQFSDPCRRILRPSRVRHPAYGRHRRRGRLAVDVRYRKEHSLRES